MVSITVHVLSSAQAWALVRRFLLCLMPLHAIAPCHASRPPQEPGSLGLLMTASLAAAVPLLRGCQMSMQGAERQGAAALWALQGICHLGTNCAHKPDHPLGPHWMKWPPTGDKIAYVGSLDPHQTPAWPSHMPQENRPLVRDSSLLGLLPCCGRGLLGGMDALVEAG